MSIVKEWEIKTRAIFPKQRSAALKELDAAVREWATKGQGIRDVNMQTAWTKLEAWRKAQPGEVARLTGPSSELETALASVWTAKASPMSGVSASGVKPDGWELVGDDPAPYGCTKLLNDLVPDLTGAEVQRINESIRRAKLACIAARDALIQVASPSHFAGGNLVPAAQGYVDFFGAFDVGRFSIVLQNFTALAIAFGRSPKIVDCRNWQLWSTTYGGCTRQNLVSRPTGISQYSKQVVHREASVTGTVTMLVGRAFLARGGYNATTDATVGTLVHEFAHGTLNAVDVPDVNGLGAFQCSRTSDDPNHPDFGNSTDPHGHQASTEEADKLLARFHPTYAIVNADCYGQFARRILTGKAE